MAGRRVRRDADGWRALLARQAESGLSAAAFCARERLSAASFYQWRSRLSRGAAVVPAAGSPRGGFVDLGALSGGGRFELRIDLGGGLMLLLARG